MPEFMILMHENDDAWAKLPDAEQKSLLQLYFGWVEDLRSRRIFLSGAPLAPGGRVLRNGSGGVTDVPYEDLHQVLTGYFLITAADLAAATQIARECPALRHGETVIVRPMGG